MAGKLRVVGTKWKILRHAVYYIVQCGQYPDRDASGLAGYLGLSYPQTLDEMKDVMLAFTNDDPDGDGQNNTYGYTAEKPGQFDWVFFAYGLPYADYSLDENDQVIPCF